MSRPGRLLYWEPAYEADCPLLPDARVRRRAAGVPVLFNEDQRPVRAVNDWLLELSATSRSPQTWRTYALELRRFARFLHDELGLELLDKEVGDDALRAYRMRCEQPDDSAAWGDSASTRGKRRAALLSFYRWAEREGLVQAVPFRLVPVRTRRGTVLTLAGLRGGRGPARRRRPIGEEQLDRLLGVGLAGLTPHGRPDPGFRRVGTAARNTAGVALGLAGGLRHAEILSISVFEIPPASADGLTPMVVPGVIAKGGRDRETIAFSRWLRHVHSYIRNERAASTASSSWRPRRPLEVDTSRTDREVVTVELRQGRWATRAWGLVDPDERRRLVLPGAGSPLLLISSRQAGRPLTHPDTLNEALREAGRRCRSNWPAEPWGFTAHNLRHTYATQLLQFLRMGEQRAEEFRRETGRYPSWRALARRTDPVLQVAQCMGHATPELLATYAENALSAGLLAVNADPAWNPALGDPAPRDPA